MKPDLDLLQALTNEMINYISEKDVKDVPLLTKLQKQSNYIMAMRKEEEAAKAEEQQEFGSYILGEIFRQRLQPKPDCWYHNGRKVSIINIYESFKQSK